MRRGMRYDGVLPATLTAEGTPRPTTPEDIHAIRAYAEQERTDGGPFDIVMEGETPGDDPARAATAVVPLAEAGATWWVESRWSDPEHQTVLQRIRQGPPSGD